MRCYSANCSSATYTVYCYFLNQPLATPYYQDTVCSHNELLSATANYLQLPRLHNVLTVEHHMACNRNFVSDDQSEFFNPYKILSVEVRSELQKRHWESHICGCLFFQNRLKRSCEREAICLDFPTESVKYDDFEMANCDKYSKSKIVNLPLVDCTATNHQHLLEWSLKAGRWPWQLEIRRELICNAFAFILAQVKYH